MAATFFGLLKILFTRKDFQNCKALGCQIICIIHKLFGRCYYLLVKGKVIILIIKCMFIWRKCGLIAYFFCIVSRLQFSYYQLYPPPDQNLDISLVYLLILSPFRHSFIECLLLIYNRIRSHIFSLAIFP